MSNSADLFDAIAAGDREAVRRILEVEPDLAESRNDAGISAVIVACYHRQAEIRDFLIARIHRFDAFECAAVGLVDRLADLIERDSAAVDAFSPDGFTALQLAAFFDHPQAARLLLERGAKVNAVAANPMAIQPLHAAAAAGAREVCEILLSAGADVNARQQGGFTPLQAVAHQGGWALADLLLANGAEPLLPNDAGQTAVDLAQSAGHADLARYLKGQSA